MPEFLVCGRFEKCRVDSGRGKGGIRAHRSRCLEEALGAQVVGVLPAEIEALNANFRTGGLYHVG